MRLNRHHNNLTKQFYAMVHLMQQAIQLPCMFYLLRVSGKYNNISYKLYLLWYVCLLCNVTLLAKVIHFKTSLNNKIMSACITTCLGLPGTHCQLLWKSFTYLLKYCWGGVGQLWDVEEFYVYILIANYLLLHYLFTFILTALHHIIRFFS